MRASAMTIAARLDDIGKPAWIGLMIVSFILFWPAGLVVLGYLIGSGRMGCWAHGRDGGWKGRPRSRNRDPLQRAVRLVVDRGADDPVARDVAAVHPRAVEGERHGAVAVDRDKPARAADPAQRTDDLLRRLGQGLAAM